MTDVETASHTYTVILDILERNDQDCTSRNVCFHILEQILVLSHFNESNALTLEILLCTWSY